MAENGTADAIGDTVFSETFVIKTLLQLTEVTEDGSKWSDALEQDLSGLWDMSGYEDVASLLVDNNFLTIAHNALANTEPEIPRLMEQVVGVLANMCSVTCVQLRISRHPDLLYLLIRMLRCTDALTLVQVVRALTVLLRVISTCDCGPLQTEHMKRKEAKRVEAERVHRRLMGLGVSLIALGADTSTPPESVDEAGNKIGDVLLPYFARGGEGMDSLVFVLKSSSHGELIASAIRLVHIVCHLDVNDGEMFGVHCASAELVRALVVAGTQLSSVSEDDEEEDDDRTGETRAYLDLVQTIEVFARLIETRDMVCTQGEVVMAALVKFCETHWRWLMPDALTVFHVLLKESSLVSDTALAMVLSVYKKLHRSSCEEVSSPWDEDEDDEGSTTGAIRERQVPYLHDLWLLNTVDPFLDETQSSEIAAILLAENVIAAA